MIFVKYLEFVDRYIHLLFKIQVTAFFCIFGFSFFPSYRVVWNICLFNLLWNICIFSIAIIHLLFKIRVPASFVYSDFFFFLSYRVAWNICLFKLLRKIYIFSVVIIHLLFKIRVPASFAYSFFFSSYRAARNIYLLKFKKYILWSYCSQCLLYIKWKTYHFKFLLIAREWNCIF